MSDIKQMPGEQPQILRDNDGRTLLSLIIPSRNRPELLAETVDSILQGEEVPAELIVVDQSDAPNEHLAALTTSRRCNVRYLHDASMGASRARNLGIAEARYHILVFTDDDVLVTRSWLRELVDALLNAGPRSVVTGRVMPAPSGKAGGFVPSTRTDQMPVDYEGRIGEDILYSNNMALFRSAIDEVGAFDVRLVNAEDNEFAFRLLEAGYRILYRPDAVLYHRAWRSDREYLSLRWSYGRGQGQYYAKHLNLQDRYMLGRLVREVRVRLLRVLTYLMRKPTRATGEITYLVALGYGLTRWLLTQRSDS